MPIKRSLIQYITANSYYEIFASVKKNEENIYSLQELSKYTSVKGNKNQLIEWNLLF